MHQPCANEIFVLGEKQITKDEATLEGQGQYTGKAYFFKGNQFNPYH
jgi:hypothetical protein